MISLVACPRQSSLRRLLSGHILVPINITFPVAMGRDPAITDVQPIGAASMMQLSPDLACSVEVLCTSPALTVIITNNSMNGLFVFVRRAAASPGTLTTLKR